MFAALVLLSTVTSQFPSDVRLDGPRLQAFLRTAGLSEAGKDVRWKVPAATFRAAPTQKAGPWVWFTHQRVALSIGAGAQDLARIRRKGKVAHVRGRVMVIPEKLRTPGGPRCVIQIREIRGRDF